LATPFPAFDGRDQAADAVVLSTIARFAGDGGKHGSQMLMGSG